MSFDMTGKIDVHVHFLPPSYRKACHEHGHAKPDGMPAVPEWSEEAHLQLMDKTGIKKSIISVSTPGTHLVHNDSELAAKVTRECNSYAADLKKRMPDRFGYWASLPIPDVDLCLKEIAKSAEEGCDGYALLTNGHGHYLGDPLFEPIFAELNRRKATIFIHPTTPCIKCTDPELNQKTHSSASNPTRATPLAAKFPNPMLEFLFDTARVVSNMFLSGTIKRNPDVKIILPHLAGASPPLLSRWTGFSQLVPGLFEPCPEEEVKEALDRQFWFDLSGMVFPGQIVGLLQGTGVSHERLMYGSDFPFTKAEGVELLRGKMDAGMKGMFGEEEIKDMYYRNAEKLLQMS